MTVADLRRRLESARCELDRIPRSESHEHGPPDPTTGESWDRYNCLGHVAEMVAFWSAAIPRALAGEVLGRPPDDNSRREGIESGPLLGEGALRERISSACDQLEALLGGFADEDLARPIETVSAGTITLGQALEQFLVGHFEAHVKQLAELTTPG
jgi:hypothetical protein